MALSVAVHRRQSPTVWFSRPRRWPTKRMTACGTATGNPYVTQVIQSEMAHDTDHSNSQHADRRRTIARPAAYPTLTEVELLQRAARHIRLRPNDLMDLMDQVRPGEESSSSGPMPPAGDPGA